MKEKKWDFLSKKAYFLVDAEEMLDFEFIFGNRNPLHVEIGCGRGEHIRARAEREPEVNFLGFELKENRIDTIVRHMNPNVHSNVRLIRRKIGSDVTKWIPGGSVDRFYLIHPDPWPKRRHHKHRLVQRRFLDASAWFLRSGAEVYVTTDHEGYASWIRKHFREHELFIESYCSQGTPWEDHIETWFGQMKKDEGFTPFFMIFERKNASVLQSHDHSGGQQGL